MKNNRIQIDHVQNITDPPRMFHQGISTGLQ